MKPRNKSKRRVSWSDEAGIDPAYSEAPESSATAEEVAREFVNQLFLCTSEHD